MHFSTTVLAFGAIASMAVAAPVAEPEAAWHSKFRYFPGQPIGKREADEEDVEADVVEEEAAEEDSE